MKIALIGATGFVGTAVLKELLDRGHQVTAIARNPGKLDLSNPLLTAKAGDVFDEEQIAQLVKGQDAVVSAYNPGWTNPNIYQDFLKAGKAIEAAVKKSGVKRFLFVGGGGSLEIAPGKQLIDTPQFPAEYYEGANGAREYLAILKNDKELDWTYLSPAILMNPDTSGIRLGKYRTGLDNPVFDAAGNSVLSVEDLALVIVDELEHPKHIRQRFTAAY